LFGWLVFLGFNVFVFVRRVWSWLRTNAGGVL